MVRSGKHGTVRTLLGGLGYVQASSVLGIRARDMAALLRTVLLRPGTSPAAAVEDGSQVGGLPQPSP